MISSAFLISRETNKSSAKKKFTKAPGSYNQMGTISIRWELSMYSIRNSEPDLAETV